MTHYSQMPGSYDPSGDARRLRMPRESIEDWRGEINEVKHRIELLIGRDGLDATLAGDTLDYLLRSTFCAIQAQTYRDAAETALFQQSNYPMHPMARKALEILASTLRNL